MLQILVCSLLLLCPRCSVGEAASQQDPREDPQEYPVEWSKDDRFTSVMVKRLMHPDNHESILLLPQPWLRSPGADYRRASSSSSSSSSSGPTSSSLTSSSYPSSTSSALLPSPSFHDVFDTVRLDAVAAYARTDPRVSGSPQLRARKAPSGTSSSSQAAPYTNSDDKDANQEEDERSIERGVADSRRQSAESMNICVEVCGVCRQVLSIRWAALCLVECRLGGRSYDACFTVWAFQHDIGIKEGRLNLS